MEMSKRKKTCDAETQVANAINYSWSYPKVLLIPLAENEPERAYTSIQEKWTNTISLKSLKKNVKNFKKFVNKNAPESDIKSTGIQRFCVPSLRHVIARKFPNTTISRSKGHCFDEGVVIWPGEPKKRKEVARRLKYKPVLQVSSQPAPPVTVVPIITEKIRDLREKIFESKKRLGDLADESKNRNIEVGKLKKLFDEDFQVHVLKRLVLDLEKSPERLAAAKRQLVDYADLFEEYVPTAIASLPVQNSPPPLSDAEILLRDSLPPQIKRPRVEQHPVFELPILERLGPKIEEPQCKTFKETSPARELEVQNSPPRTVARRLRESAAAYEPIPLRVGRKSTLKKPLSDVLKDMRQKKEPMEEKIFKIPMIPKIRANREQTKKLLKSKDEAEFAQQGIHMEVARERVEKRQTKIENLMSSLFDIPATAAKQKVSMPPPWEENNNEPKGHVADKELDKDFKDFEFLDE